jgi:hypothetical protein
VAGAGNLSDGLGDALRDALDDALRDAPLQANEQRQFQSFWLGRGTLVHALYALSGLAGREADVMDVAAVRETQGQQPVCQPAPPGELAPMGSVRAGVGLGAGVVAGLAALAPNGSVAALGSPGELGHLLTLFAATTDAAVRSVALEGLLAVYVRGEAARGLASRQGAATEVVRGRLGFTREFRRWCNAAPTECVYEYVMPWHLRGSVHELRCAGGEDPAAQAWLRQSFGAVHDGGHIRALCRLQEPTLRSLAVLVHGMRFMLRATGGWGRDVVFDPRDPQHPRDPPPEARSLFWPLVAFRT